MHPHYLCIHQETGPGSSSEPICIQVVAAAQGENPQNLFYNIIAEV